MQQLKDPFGLSQVFQLMCAQIAQCNACGQHVSNKRGCGAGQQGLTTVRERTQPGAPIDCRAVVVTLAHVGLASVQCHVHAQRLRQWPGLLKQSQLNGGGRCYRGTGLREDGKAAVALTSRTHEHALVRCDQPLDERVVAGQDRRHDRRMLLPQTCAGLNVREQEGHRAGRQWQWHPARVRWPVGDRCIQHIVSSTFSIAHSRLLARPADQHVAYSSGPSACAHLRSIC